MMVRTERKRALMLAVLSGLSVCLVSSSQADDSKPQPKKVYPVADLVMPIQRMGVLGGGGGKTLANSQANANMAIMMPTVLTYPSREEFKIQPERGKEYRRFSISHTLRNDERLIGMERRLKDIESKLDLLLKKEQ